MNETPNTNPPEPADSFRPGSQPTAADEQLVAARNYWREIERVTKGRYLHGAELAIAEDAWSAYVSALRESENLNPQRSLERQERQKPLEIGKMTPSQLAEVGKRSDAELPDAPKRATIPYVTPPQLAEVATRLAAQAQTKSAEPVRDLFAQAYELLIQAASFLTEQRAKPALDVFFEAEGVSFDDILGIDQKSDRDSLKLLRGFSGGKSAKGAERYAGLSKLIRRYYRQAEPVPAEETAEKFIRNRFLPTIELVKIRAWHFRSHRAHVLKNAETLQRRDSVKSQETRIRPQEPE